MLWPGRAEHPHNGTPGGNKSCWTSGRKGYQKLWISLDCWYVLFLSKHVHVLSATADFWSCLNSRLIEEFLFLWVLWYVGWGFFMRYLKIILSSLVNFLDLRSLLSISFQRLWPLWPVACLCGFTALVFYKILYYKLTWRKEYYKTLWQGWNNPI